MSLLFLTLQCSTIFFVVKLLIGYTSVSRKAINEGCEPAHVIPRKDPLGLLRARAHGQARDQCRWPAFLIEILDTVGDNINTAWDRLLGTDFLLTRDPDNVRAVLVSQAEAFVMGEGRSENFMQLVGRGVLTSQGEAWRHSRALVRPQFARQQISDPNHFEFHLQQLWRRIIVAGDRWTDIVDLQPLFFNFTIDTITELVLGYSVHSQNFFSSSPLSEGKCPALPDPAEFASNIDAGAYWVALRVAFGKWYWLFRSKDFDRNCKVVHDYVDRFVHLELSRRMNPQAEQTQSAKGNFVLLEELSKITQDPLVLRGEVLNLIVAGRGTTAALLGWVFFFLSRDSSVYDKLRKAIFDEFGASGDLDCTKLLSCQYLQYCLKETLRLCPAGPALIRKATKDVRLPRGGGEGGKSPVLVPKDSMVMLCMHAMQTRADIWGEDAEDFKPDRWRERPFAWDYLPFSAGPRNCVGRE